MQRILAIDDDVGVTNVLKRGLAYEGFAVDTANSGADGLLHARDHYPDLIILDIMMPDLDGWAVLDRLRAADASLPILMLTAKDTAGDQVAGFGHGADDYVVKPFSFNVLLARIRSLLRRHTVDHPTVLCFANLRLDTGSRQAQRGSRTIDLTTTEYALLCQFLEHPQRVLPKDFLMDRVWGYDFGGNANVLEVYISQLRQKLEGNGEVRVIHTVRGTGYVLREA